MDQAARESSPRETKRSRSSSCPTSSLRGDEPAAGTAAGKWGHVRLILGREFLDLRAAKGRLTRFSYSARAKSAYDENDCAIDLAALKPIPAPSGIALRARDDDLDDTGEDALHCSPRLRGGRDFLVERRARTCKAKQ